MSIVQNLYGRFQIAAYEPLASEEDIEKLRRFSSIPVPADYIDVVESMTEVEILLGGKKYIRIWGPTGSIEMNQVYDIQRYIPRSLAIGDDEGGSALILMTGKEGYGLYKVGFGDLGSDDAEFVSHSLQELLVRGEGWENI